MATELKFQDNRPDEFFPRDWQSLDLSFLDKLDNSANWSSMGTFKTSTGLWLADRKLKQGKGNVLIVTTKSGKGAYFDAIPRCLNHGQWAVFNIGTRKVEEVVLRDLRMEFDIEDLITLLKLRKQRNLVLAHYHCFTNKSQMNEILLAGSQNGQVQWDFILLDEAHKIKNKDVQWGRNLKKMAHANKQEKVYRHVMTGTGFVNNPSEVWSLIHFLEPSKYPSYWRFRREYCEEESWSGYDKIVGIKADKVEDFRTMRKSFGPRRTMEEVHSTIAEPIYHTVKVELNTTQRRMYKEIVAELYMLDQQGYPIHAPNVVSQLQRLRQISVATPELVDSYYDPEEDRRIQIVKLVEPSSKLDAVMDLLEGMEWDNEQRQQMVVFSNFKDPLELLKKRFDKAGISFIHMEQKDSEQTRFEKWHEQFPLKEHQVFLSTIDLGGESINLTPAQYCVFLDRSWSPAKNLQAVGRVYRPGQTGTAEIIHIDATNTVDKRVLDNVSTKTGWFKKLFDDDE